MKHRFLSALLAAAMAVTTTVPAVSAAERSAAADNPAAEQLHTIPTMETPLAMANPTAKEAYDIMIAMKAEYPEGMPFTNDNYYGWKGGIYSGGYGCAAFAFMLSDAVFGTAMAKRTTEFVSNNVRVGDILRNNSHSYIVLEVKSNSFIIAEANFNGTVHWEREITFKEVSNNFEEHLTRYDDTSETTPTTTTTQKATTTTTTTTSTTTTTTTTTSKPTTTTTTTTTSTEMTQGARMEIAVMPVKTLYADYTYKESDGWQLDTTGLRVNVWHESENGEELVYEEFNPLLDPAHFSFTGLDKNVYGKQNITVTYHDFNHEKNEDIIATASFIVELIDLNAEPERCVFEMKLKRLPDKLTYRMDEPLDLSGIFGEVRIFDSKQTVITEFDAEEIRNVERYVLSDYHPSVLGEQEITVIYQFFNAEKNEDVRCAAAFTVTVLDAFGDVNCDKNADASDAAQILVASAAVGAGGASGLTAEQERDIDVDRDGDFDAADAAIILTYAAYSGTGGTMTLREYLNQ